jgi:RNase P/RNase MRP subunit POP5
MAVTKTVKKNAVKRASQKVLLPTLKEQQRYIVYAVLLSSKDGMNFANATFAEIHNQIIARCSVLLGVFDGAKAGLMSAKYNEKTSRGIIRVDNKYVDKLKVCLGLIKEISFADKKISLTIDCVYVSGLLNKAEDIMNSDNG